jgi:HD-like signal output (HDOD) protein
LPRLRPQGVLAPLDRHRRLCQSAGTADAFQPGLRFHGRLLHDIGRLVLVSCFPQQYGQALAYRKAHDCYAGSGAQRARRRHVDAGLALAEHWNFSDTMRLAIGGHHDPEAPGAGFLAAIIHMADAIVHALDLAKVQDDLVPPISTVAWTAWASTKKPYLQLFRETELQYEEISMVLLSPSRQHRCAGTDPSSAVLCTTQWARINAAIIPASTFSCA